jgi:acetolactate synthase I/II/III large subunit
MNQAGNQLRQDFRMTRMTTAEATVASLIAHGLDTIYALPGVHNDHLFDALFQAGDRLRTVHTRHEQAASLMALGAALATGKPQACTVVPGPGLLNAATGLLTAYGTNAPVLGLIGHITQSAIGRGYGHLHEIRDQAGIIARLVDFTARIRAPAEAPGLVASAFRAMKSGRPGPAVLECAIDVWGRSATVPPIAPPDPPPAAIIDEEAVDAAAKCADRGRRWRPGRLGRGHGIVGTPCGPRDGLSSRPRRARWTQSDERDAAARP